MQRSLKKAFSHMEIGSAVSAIHTASTHAPGTVNRARSTSFRRNRHNPRAHYMRRSIVFLAGSIAFLVLAAGVQPLRPNFNKTTAQGIENSLNSRSVAGQFILGQRPFSPSSSWNTPISVEATYIPIAWPAPTGYNYGVAWNEYSPAVYVSSASDPVALVTYPAGWGYKGGVLDIRMPPEADGAAGTDQELLLIDGNIVHNFWQFKRLSPTAASARSYGATNVLLGSGWGSTLPFLSAGIVAAGSSQLAGLLVQAETDLGDIAHALQLCIDSALAKPGYTGDAINGDGKNPNGIVQEGERLAIPPQTPMPPGLSPLGRKVFRAYQTYGAFVVDVSGGVTNLRAQANAYDSATIAALRRDMRRITPMLQRVQ
jgi:hypothetical protein